MIVVAGVRCGDCSKRWLESISFVVGGGGIIAEEACDRKVWRFFRICVRWSVLKLNQREESPDGGG